MSIKRTELLLLGLLVAITALVGLILGVRTEPPHSTPGKPFTPEPPASRLNAIVAPTPSQQSAQPAIPETRREEEGLLLVAQDESADLQSRMDAIGVLAGKGQSDASPVFLHILAATNEHIAIRYKAARALGVTTNIEAIPLLSQILTDAANDRHLRLVCALALGGIGTEASGIALAAAAKDSDDLVRFKVVQALGQCYSSATLPTLLAALEDPDLYVQARAIHSLADSSVSNAIPIIVATLADNDAPFTKIACLEALGSLGGEASASAIAAYHSSSNSLLSESALLATRKLEEASQ